MPYLLQGLSIGFILSHLKVPFDENTRKSKCQVFLGNSFDYR